MAVLMCHAADSSRARFTSRCRRHAGSPRAAPHAHGPGRYARCTPFLLIRHDIVMVAGASLAAGSRAPRCWRRGRRCCPARRPWQPPGPGSSRLSPRRYASGRRQYPSWSRVRRVRASTFLGDASKGAPTSGQVSRPPAHTSLPTCRARCARRCMHRLWRARSRRVHARDADKRERGGEPAIECTRAAALG